VSKPEKPLFDDIKQEFRSLAGDAAEMAELRWQLAQVELANDLAALQRLAVWLAAVVLLILTSLPLVAVCASELLDGFCGISEAGWLAIIALALIASAAIFGLLAWRRFRRTFTGMVESLEELREDIVWLKEWTGENGDGK